MTLYELAFIAIIVFWAGAYLGAEFEPSLERNKSWVARVFVGVAAVSGWFIVGMVFKGVGWWWWWL